jgi:hypothetical protein
MKGTVPILPTAREHVLRILNAREQYLCEQGREDIQFQFLFEDAMVHYSSGVRCHLPIAKVL